MARGWLKVEERKSGKMWVLRFKTTWCQSGPRNITNVIASWLLLARIALHHLDYEAAQRVSNRRWIRMAQRR